MALNDPGRNRWSTATASTSRAFSGSTGGEPSDWTSDAPMRPAFSMRGAEAIWGKCQCSWQPSRRPSMVTTSRTFLLS